MSTAKTLALLEFFSTTRPEIGLSEFCRLARRDKATTYRHLQALESAGFVEKNPLTKHYRLGPALLQLSQIREMTVPRKSSAEAALSALANATGETSHVSILSGHTVYPLAFCNSPEHGTRAIIDLKTFPLHATASGLCALAFGPEELFEQATGKMEIFTRNTAKTPKVLRRIVDGVKESGFSSSNRAFEDDVSSLSVPVFDHTGLFAGAVTVAAVATRLTDRLERTIQKNLVIASREITRNWGGAIPPSIENRWAKSLSKSKKIEAMS